MINTTYQNREKIDTIRNYFIKNPERIFQNKQQLLNLGLYVQLKQITKKARNENNQERDERELERYELIENYYIKNSDRKLPNKQQLLNLEFPLFITGYDRLNPCKKFKEVVDKYNNLRVRELN